MRFDWDDTALPNLIASGLGLALPYSDQTLTLSGKNERDVPVRFLSRNLSCKKCPFAVISHGTFAGSHDYDAIAQPLIERGYHVAIPVHPDSKSHPLNTRFSPKNYTAYRIEDHQLILEHIAQNYGADTKWVSIGHSFGAVPTAYFAGASPDESLLKESALGQPSHAITLSPPGIIPNVLTDESFAKLQSPTLIVTGTEDIVPTMIEDWRDHLDMYQGAPKGKAKAIIFEGQDHYFNGLYGRPKNRARVQADDDLIRLIMAFINNEPLASGQGYSVKK